MDYAQSEFITHLTFCPLNCGHFFGWNLATIAAIVGLHSQGVINMAQSKQKPKTQSNGTKPPKSK